MELIQVGEQTYYIKNVTNIGVYKTSENEVYLIDAGGDKDAGKKILKIIDGEGWKIKGIISTHSNADHIGGNALIQDRTGCEVLGYGIEKAMTEYPMLSPSFLYGGYPFADIRNKYLLPKPSKVYDIDGNLPEGLSYFSLKGHFFDMIGIKTSDDVYFLADSLVSAQTIEKYHIFVVYDVKEYLATLDFLSEQKAKLFIPSHCEASDDISGLISVNRDKIFEICDKIYNACDDTLFEDILAQIFLGYGLSVNPNQYVLVGSTVRSYLSYLYDAGKITYEFKNGKMLWKKA